MAHIGIHNCGTNKNHEVKLGSMLRVILQMVKEFVHVESQVVTSMY